MRSKLIFALALILASPAYAGDSTVTASPGSGGPVFHTKTDGSGNNFGYTAIGDGAAGANAMAVKAASTAPSATDPAAVFALSPNSLGGTIGNGIFVNPATGATFAVSGSVSIIGWAGGTIGTGTLQAFGATQGTIGSGLVPAFNAYIVNTIAAVTLGDAVTTSAYGSGSPTYGALALWNGTTYDRWKEAGATGVAAVGGAAASGASLSGNPVPEALRGSTADQTAVSDGQAIVPEVTPNGKQIVQPWALTPNLADGGGSSTGTGTFTILAASGTAGVKEYLTGLQCGRSDTGTTAITVAISDGTKTRTFVIPANGGGGGNNPLLVTPIAFAANTAVTAAFSSGVTTGYCNAEGFYAP